MLHVATVHFQSDDWVRLQVEYLRRNLSMPFRVWASPEGVSESLYDYFDVVVPAFKGHAGKLNLLAAEIASVAAPDDLIMFLDGDAFPVAPLDEHLQAWMAEVEVVAVRRDENGDAQPHPCFTVMPVATWLRIHGDWSPGFPWRTADGNLITDVGGNLLRLLELNEVTWKPLLRTNQHDLDPMWFGVYGGLIYHHGAGFRKPWSRLDDTRAPPDLFAAWAQVPGVGRLTDRADRRRQRRWRAHRIGLAQATSERIRRQIEVDPLFYENLR